MMIGLFLSKKDDKGLCIVVWIEAEKQLSDPSVYRDVSNGENILPELSKASNCSLV